MRHAFGEGIDPRMRVDGVAVPHPQREDRGVEVPLQLLQLGVRQLQAELARDDVEGGHAGHDDQQPPGCQSDPLEQPAHGLRHLQQGVHRVRPAARRHAPKNSPLPRQRGPAQQRAAPASAHLLVEVGRLHQLRFAPDGVLLAEVEVVVGDLLEGRVLCRLFLEHVEPRLLEGGQVLVTPALDLNLVLVAHLGHDAELHRLALGKGDDHLRLARDLDHRLVGIGQLVVRRLVHQQLAARHLLVPAREVVELGDLVEAELHVHHRHRELRGVDHAALERRIDVGRGQQLGGDAELLHHLRAEAEEAHLHALQLGQRFDLLAEPAGGLGADAEDIDGGQAVLGVDLVPQLVAAAVPLPGQELADTRAERHRGEECRRGIFTGVIARRRPARLDRSLGDRIEALERGNQRAGLEELDFELASGHALDVLREAHTGRAKVRERAAEGALHLPADSFLGAGRRGQHGDGQGRCGQDP